MNKLKLKNEIKNIDMDKIDSDIFGEGLLTCIPKIPDICKYIDMEVCRMSNTAFIPWVSTTSQYDQIVENINTKKELTKLHKLFFEWYHQLTHKQKQIYVAYFVRRDNALCKKVCKAHGSHWFDRCIRPMYRSFLSYLRCYTDFKEEELIKNIFIYRFYHTTANHHKGEKMS